VVDDHPANVKALRVELTADGHDVIEATNGYEAVEAVERDAPDLVLLDIMMPGATGLEILEKIREMDDRKSTPVVILTAKGQDADREAAFSLGADDFLTKPFSPKKLLARIHEIIEGD